MATPHRFRIFLAVCLFTVLICSNVSASICNGRCTDLMTDNNNCGVCGISCGWEKCINGHCPSEKCVGVVCSSGQNCCGGKCVNLRTNPENCGTCGISCGREKCTIGHCAADFCIDIKCPSGQNCCGGNCLNLMTSRDNCGGCAISCKGGECINGHCVNDPCTGVLCPAGNGCCGGKCISLTTKDNCGTCGNKCSPLNHCKDGVCVNRFTGKPDIGSGIPPLTLFCFGGLTACNGKCLNTMTDPDNCGKCGKICDKSYAGSVCIQGTCKVSCNDGWDCNNNPADGCEKPRYGDSCNCNGISCYIPEINAIGDCRNEAGCGSGLECKNYDFNPWDLDCSMTTGQTHVNVYSDPNNCGGCGFKCVTGQVCDHLTCKSP